MDMLLLLSGVSIVAAVHVLYAYAAGAEGDAIASRLPEALEIGVGKAASAAAMTERLCKGSQVDLVCLFGVCGAYPQSDPPLEITDLCVVESDVLADEGVAMDKGFSDLAEMELGTVGPFEMDRRLTARAAEFLDVPTVRGATVSTCSGTDVRSRDVSERTGAQVETMEGAAVALACQRLGVPLVQLRCVSNHTGEQREDMDLPRAVQRLQVVTLKLAERGWL
jgi:futalosine hydrolase